MRTPKTTISLDSEEFDAAVTEVSAFAEFSERVLKLRETLFTLLKGGGELVSVKAQSTSGAGVTTRLEISNEWRAFLTTLRASDFHSLLVEESGHAKRLTTKGQKGKGK
jgi:hypothetical protein